MTKTPAKTGGCLRPSFQQELFHTISPINILHGQLEAIPETLRGFVTPNQSSRHSLHSPTTARPAVSSTNSDGSLQQPSAPCFRAPSPLPPSRNWAAYPAATSLRATGFTAPHVTTFQRVLAKLDAENFDRAIGAWTQTQVTARVIAIDGKEVRGAKNGGGDRVHLMAALDHEARFIA